MGKHNSTRRFICHLDLQYVLFLLNMKLLQVAIYFNKNYLICRVRSYLCKNIFRKEWGKCSINTFEKYFSKS